MITLTEAREYFPVETAVTDEELLRLIADIDYFQEKILSDYFGLGEVEQKLYNK